MRTPMITRTIVATKATLLCVDIADQSTFQKEVTLPRTYKDAKALMKAAVAVVDDDNTKVVSIVSSETFETLYGMTELDFIQYAKVLPPRVKVDEE